MTKANESVERTRMPDPILDFIIALDEHKHDLPQEIFDGIAALHKRLLELTRQ